jgi:Cu+-exporting ATPase
VDSTRETLTRAFVFADISGFTALTEAHGDDDAASIAESFEFRSMGETRFKNVAEPIALWELVVPDRPVPSGSLDPVCRMRVDPSTAPARLTHRGRDHYFCSLPCAGAFAAAPERYAP